MSPSDLMGRQAIVEALGEAARWSAMHPADQLRFESMLRQMAGQKERKEPLPMPPEDKRDALYSGLVIEALTAAERAPSPKGSQS